MATKTAEKTDGKVDYNELVEVTIPRSARAYKDEEAMIVCVNGERIMIKYGEPVKIKRKFAEVIERHFKWRDLAEDYVKANEFGAAKQP